MNEQKQEKSLHLVGIGVGHSIAPAMHNFITTSLNLPWTFHATECATIEDILALAHSPDTAGLVVTMPYKTSIMPHLDALDDLAVQIGACNNVYLDPNDSRPLRGTNTDWLGIKGSLLKKSPDNEPVLDRPALIVGAGGASRAAVYALHTHFKVSVIYVLNRGEQEVAELKADSKRLQSPPELIHLQIGTLLDSVSPSAEKVGAINTIVARGAGVERMLHGDNTDWIGISRCIERSADFDPKSSTGLILGARGAARAACYALLIVNRTLSKAEEMAAYFNGVPSRSFNTLGEASMAAKVPIRVVIACVPADDLSKDKISTELFSGSEAGVLVEMAHRPHVTGMMEAAADRKEWHICRGIDVLKEQAYEQFQM